MAKRNVDVLIAGIEEAMRAKDDFMNRVKLAEGSVSLCAHLLAEAVDMHTAANGLETVGKDGRVRVTPQDIFASHCLIAARDAYRRTNNQFEVKTATPSTTYRIGYWQSRPARFSPCS